MTWTDADGRIDGQTDRHTQRHTHTDIHTHTDTHTHSFSQVELRLSNYQSVLKDLIEPRTKQPSFSQVKWALSMFYAEPEDRFEMQQVVDKGDVDKSQCSMYASKKLNILIDREFVSILKDSLEALYGLVCAS